MRKSYLFVFAVSVRWHDTLTVLWNLWTGMRKWYPLN
jgi:hypothetical protein